ncbi:hypothetical protein [Kaistia terrae]|uniref:Uncharacterized protein n=1 Tax=Kaistia terrae TaxID=537017 RepID=A0ABW0Q3S2_9HYPH|nr:hypothetical protein [Kaistia terrae]MCX5581510.1 hypothetical protein [Kaistia terrae]
MTDAKQFIARAFELSGEMEDTLFAISQLVAAIDLIAEALDEDPASGAIMRIAWTIKDHVKAAESHRREIRQLSHHLVHPEMAARKAVAA